jgi:type IV conjugative transfer system protein TraE
VESNRVSPEYLEQMGVFFAILGGNLSPSNAAYNVKFLSNYIPSDVYGDVKTELASQAYYIVKHNITQAFFPSATNVIEAENRVLVEGNVIRNIGTTKVSQEKMVINYPAASGRGIRRAIIGDPRTVSDISFPALLHSR